MGSKILSNLDLADAKWLSHEIMVGVIPSFFATKSYNISYSFDETVP